MVKLSKSSKKILDLQRKYIENKEFKKLEVLKNFPYDVPQLPYSFDISTTFCDCDIIKEVLEDLGIPSILILQVCQKKDKFHIELCDTSR